MLVMLSGQYPQCQFVYIRWPFPPNLQWVLRVGVEISHKKGELFPIVNYTICTSRNRIHIQLLKRRRSFELRFN
jgi:hypothetical protein